MSEPLLPCPYCGSADIYLNAFTPSMQCWACDALGPKGDDEREARYLWNQRSPAAAPRAMGAE